MQSGSCRVQDRWPCLMVWGSEDGRALREKGSREHLLRIETTGSSAWMIYDLAHFMSLRREVHRQTRLIGPQGVVGQSNQILSANTLHNQLELFWGCCSTRACKRHTPASHASAHMEVAMSSYVFQHAVMRYSGNACILSRIFHSHLRFYRKCEPQPSLLSSGTYLHELTHFAHRASAVKPPFHSHTH